MYLLPELMEALRHLIPLHFVYYKTLFISLIMFSGCFLKSKQNYDVI